MKYGILKQYIEKFNLWNEVSEISYNYDSLEETEDGKGLHFVEKTKVTGFQIGVNNIHHSKNGEWCYFWFETLLQTDKLTEETEVYFSHRYSMRTGKTDKSVWTDIAVTNRIEKELNVTITYNKEDTEKETAINVVKETINNDSICGNSFYKVVFNNDLEDSLTIDEYSNNNDKEYTLNEIETRKKEITFIGYFEGSYEKDFFGNLPESSEEEKEDTNNTNNPDMIITEEKKQEIFNAFENNTNDVNLNDFDIEIVKESFFEFAEEMTKDEYYQLEEDISKVGIRDYELMNETREKKFNDLFAEYMEQYNNKKEDEKQDNLEISNFVGKKYVSEYTINGNEYKSIISVLAQNYGLLHVSREVFQNGKDFMNIEKSIKLSRLKEGLKTGFYKELKQDKPF